MKGEPINNYAETTGVNLDSAGQTGTMSPYIIFQEKYRFSKILLNKRVQKCVTIELHTIYLSTVNNLETVLEMNLMCHFSSLHLISITWKANPGPSIRIEETSLNKIFCRQQHTFEYSKHPN